MACPFYAADCDGLKLQNITVRHAEGMGIFSEEYSISC